MKNLRILVVLGPLLAGLLLVSCASSAGLPAIKIVVATDPTSPPFESVDKQTQKIVGFDIDIMNAVAANQNLNVEYKNVPWAPLLAGMAQGTYDAAISSITITEDRKKEMLFSDPYFAAGQVVVVRDDNTDIKGKDTLKGQVGVQTDTKGDVEVKKIRTVALVVQYDQISAAFQDLLTGQVNAVVCDNRVAVLYVGQNPGKLKLAGAPFTDESYGIAVAKNKTSLLSRINAGLKAVKSAGVIEKAAATWFK